MSNSRAIIVNDDYLWRAVYHLTWMHDTLAFQQAQTGIGAELSPELQDAKALSREFIDMLCQDMHVLTRKMEFDNKN